MPEGALGLDDASEVLSKQLALSAMDSRGMLERPPFEDLKL
jgi:hypothetical protein